MKRFENTATTSAATKWQPGMSRGIQSAEKRQCTCERCNRASNAWRARVIGKKRTRNRSAVRARMRRLVPRNVPAVGSAPRVAAFGRWPSDFITCLTELSELTKTDLPARPKAAAPNLAASVLSRSARRLNVVDSLLLSSQVCLILAAYRMPLLNEGVSSPEEAIPRALGYDQPATRISQL